VAGAQMTDQRTQDPTTAQQTALATMQLQVEFLSDWHCGTGSGQPSGIDRLVARDRDNCPHINQKTVNGLLRDSAERVAHALDNGNDDGPWASWVTWLFGSEPALDDSEDARPLPGHLMVSAARLGPEVRRAVACRPEIARGLGIVRPGVAIDPKTKGAKKNFLRFVEVARAGLILTADLVLPDDCPEPGRVLLRLAAHELDRIGGKRRRGFGRCDVTLSDGEVADAIDWIKALDESDPPLAPLSETAPPNRTAVGARHGTDAAEMLEFELAITTVDPVLIVAETRGNVVVGSPYLPGTVLLAHIARRLPVDVAPFIANDELMVGAGLLEVGGERSRPIPASFKVAKGTDHDAATVQWNTLVERVPEDVGPTERRSLRWTAPSRPGISAPSATTRMVVTAHNAIGNERQTADEDGGGLFSYAAIDVDQTFLSKVKLSADLVTKLDHTDAGWLDVLTGSARLGRSRRTYGRVEIGARTSPAPVVDSVSGSEEKDNEAVEEFTVWLVTPCLLFDDALRADPTVERLRLELEAQLGVELKLLHSPSVAETRIDTWQQRWERPRASLFGLAAGSVAAFEASEPVLVEDLHRVERRGLGRRRAEGFGELLLNADLVSNPASVRRIVTASDEPVDALPTIDRSPLAIRLEHGAWRQEISVRCAALAIDSPRRRESGFDFGSINRSQLGSLRNVAEGLQTAAGRAHARSWLAHVEVTPRRREKYPKKLRSKLESLFAEDPNRTVWQLLGMTEAGMDRLSITDDSAGCANELRWEATAQLLTTLCSRETDVIDLTNDDGATER